VTRGLHLYVASPVSSYGTPYRGRALAAIRVEVGGRAVIHDPAVLFTTDDAYSTTGRQRQ